MDVFESIKEQLSILTGSCVIDRDAMLVEDLGLDSMRFVDLTVALEAVLGFTSFPMQAWVDRCIEQRARLTVGALEHECLRLLRTDAQPGGQLNDE